jgi:hypothetical protein
MLKVSKNYIEKEKLCLKIKIFKFHYDQNDKTSAQEKASISV